MPPFPKARGTALRRRLACPAQACGFVGGSHQGKRRKGQGKAKKRKRASWRRKPGKPPRIHVIYWGMVPAARKASREGWSCPLSLSPLWLLDGERNQERSLELAVGAQLQLGEARAIEVESLGAFGIEIVTSKSKVFSLRLAQKRGGGHSACPQSFWSFLFTAFLDTPLQTRAASFSPETSRD